MILLHKAVRVFSSSKLDFERNKIFIYVHWYFALCEGVKSPGTGVINNFEMPCEWWELNQILWKSC